MITVRYKPSFLKEYKKLPNDLQGEIREKIELFRKDPRHPFLKTHKLKGDLRGRFSFSVNYAYRIVFRYDGKNAAILLGVGTHKIYQ